MKGTSINFGGLLVPGLTILFVYLKLTAQITWPWLWVLAPVWVSMAFVVIVLTIVGIIAAAVAFGGKK
jgi:hypothetical protein